MEEIAPVESQTNGYVTEDSESDFVDVRDIENWKQKNDDSTSLKPEIRVNGAPVTKLSPAIARVQRSETTRSSLKSPLSKVKQQEEGRKRTISFNLHDTKPQVSIEAPKDEKLRSLFAPSRWSTSSSESDAPNTADEETPQQAHVTSLPENDDVIVKSNKTTRKPADTELDKARVMHLAAMNKCKSLKHDASRKLSIDVIMRRRHSEGDEGVQEQGAALRDSAIDLISDDENSEVYTAVSLAGTMKRSTQPVYHRGFRKKYVIIGIAVGSVVAIAVIIVLIVLLAKKN